MQHLRIDATKTFRLLYSVLTATKPKLAKHIAPEDHFITAWGLSDKDHENYIQALERHYQIRISARDRKQITSIQSTVDYLMKSAQVFACVGKIQH